MVENNSFKLTVLIFRTMFSALRLVPEMLDVVTNGFTSRVLTYKASVMFAIFIAAALKA